MKFKHILLGIMVIATLVTINSFGTPLAYSSKHHHHDDTTVSQGRSSSSVSPVDPIVCWTAGGILLLSGVPIPAVIAAGQTAHAAGVCP